MMIDPIADFTNDTTKKEKRVSKLHAFVVEALCWTAALLFIAVLLFTA